MTTTTSSYVWWTLYTLVAATSFGMLLALDGFFGTTKNEETLFFGTRDCAPLVMAGLGYGAPALGVGRPKTEYIESLPLQRAIYDGSAEDRRSRRSGNIEQIIEGDNSYGLVFGSNATLHGPIHLDPKKETRCHDLVKIWDDKIGNGMETDVAKAAADTDSDNLKVMLNFLENEPDAFDTMMCLGMTQAPAATCVTHPHFRYDMDINGKEESDGKKYDGFFSATGGAGHTITTDADIIQCPETVPAAGTDCPGTVTLANNRHYYARTESGRDLIDDKEDDLEDFVDKEWKPCEMRSREECGDSRTYQIQQGANANQRVNKIQECVMSSPRPTPTVTAANEDLTADPPVHEGDPIAATEIKNINPYLVASVQYLVEKTGVDFNKVMCRYYGNKNGPTATVTVANNHLYGVANKQCDGVITESPPGVYARQVGDYDGEKANLADVDYLDEKQDVGVDDLSAANSGGKDFMTFARHDQYVLYEHDGAALYRLTEEDVEFLAAYVATTYAYLLDTATRYIEEDDDGELATEALASRESLFANIRGDCFSPGLSGGGLLYQGGFGAAYFAFGIILIVCHLLWLMYAVTDDESKRFMASRAMSLFGILTALAGLYILFFIYGSGQGEIYNSDELRRFADIIGNSDRDEAEGFLGRLNHGKLSVFDNDSGFTTTATITALEALHFVFLAFAIVVPVYKEASGEKGGHTSYL